MTVQAMGYFWVGTSKLDDWTSLATGQLGLQATDRGPELVERSPMLATALNPVIGYDEAAKLAKESMRTGRSIRQLARTKGVTEATLNRVLDLGKMTRPGLDGPGGG